MQIPLFSAAPKGLRFGATIAPPQPQLSLISPANADVGDRFELTPKTPENNVAVQNDFPSSTSPNLAPYCPQRPLLLMSDYDGTLHPLVAKYGDSSLTPKQLQSIQRVATQPGVFFSIVSGRPVDQLLKIFGTLSGTPMFLVGCHGGEIYDLQNNIYLKRPPEQNKVLLLAATNELAKRGVFKFPGTTLEYKQTSLSLHFANARPEDIRTVQETISEVLQERPEFRNALAIRPGKNIIEVLPKDFNKGMAVVSLLPYAQQRFGPDAPIHLAYTGDDIADYDAMKIVHQFDGCTFLVSDKPKKETNAFVTQVLPNTQSVYQYLDAVR